MFVGVFAFITEWPTSAAAADNAFQFPAGQRQLFLDDHGVGKIENLKRTMHQPQKKGAVIHSPNPLQTIQTRTAPIWDPKDKVFKLWVLSVDDVLWQSPDGLNWTPGPKPNLPVRMVVYDEKDPDPARRFKAAILDAGFAVSPDGIHWTKLDVPKIASSDEGNFSYNAKQGLFIHTVKRGGPYGRAVAIATSEDFQNWNDLGLVFHSDSLDQKLGNEAIEKRRANPSLKQTEYHTPEHYSVQIYNMGVFAYEGLYIGLPSMYHHTGKVPKDWPGFDKMHLSPYIFGLVRKHGDYTGFYTIQLVSSRNLKIWKRLGDRKPFIETSPMGGGAYDLQTIIGPSTAVVHGDELWFYYTGIKQYAFISSGQAPGYDDYVPDAGAICLAVLRRDGFLSLDAGADVGTLTTKPFTVSGSKLFVNVDCHKNGDLRAELLGENGKMLAQSVALTGDQTRGEILWKRNDVVTLKGKTVRLRLTLKNASLYSYWLAN